MNQYPRNDFTSRHRSLRELIQSHKEGMDEYTARLIVDAILDHLTPLHAAGAGHGDVRPETILLDADGIQGKTRVHIIQDHAHIETLAAIRAKNSVENSKQCLAVPSLIYTAPEIIASGVHTPVTDIYSLGVIAYELLTGGLPDGPWHWSCQHCAYGYMTPGYNARREWHPCKALFVPGIQRPELTARRNWDSFCYWTTREPQQRLSDLNAARQCLHDGRPPMPFAIGRNVWTIDEEKPIQAVNAMAFSPDGLHLLTVVNQNQMQAWNPQDGTRATTLTVPPELQDNLNQLVQAGSRAVFSPCGRYLYLLVRADPVIINVWDMLQSTKLTTLTVPRSALTAVMFNCNGESLVTILGNDIIRPLHLQTGKRLRQWRYDKLNLERSAITPDCRTMIAADKRQLYMLSAERDSPPRIQEIPYRVRRVSISPDGSMVVAVTARGIRAYKLPEFEPAWIAWHVMGRITALAFSQDSRKLVTSAKDAVRVWDIRTGRQCARLPPLSALWEINHLRFSPDGNRLALATSDGVVSVWNTVDRKTYPPDIVEPV